MSSKGNPYDDAMAGQFLSILKTEYIHRHKPKAFAEAADLIDKYLLRSASGIKPEWRR